MCSIDNNYIGNDFDPEKFNFTKPHLCTFPDELLLEIFSHLNLAMLGTLCLVSKEWKQLTSEPSLWKNVIYKEIAFGNDKWAQRFGKEVVEDEDNKEEFSSLPWTDFIADCKKFKSLFPEKTAKNCLMLVRLPKTLNGILTLKSLGQLIKKYFPYNKEGFRHFGCIVQNELRDKSIDKSRWVMMTKDVLPNSRNESYIQQEDRVYHLTKMNIMGYEVPETLECTVCILAQYCFDLETRLFSDMTQTRCKDKAGDLQILVGGFANDGLRISNISFNDNNRTGIAALRKF